MAESNSLVPDGTVLPEPTDARNIFVLGRSMGRTLLAVSGTLQDGFELRGNLDLAEVPAVLVGAAVVKGVKAYLDIKEPGCREYQAPPMTARVNPANVVTGEARDANLYAVYLVDERVVLRALLGEPRYLAIAPDAVRVDLRAEETSPAVVALLEAVARDLDPSAPPPSEVSLLTVLSTHLAPTFVPLPPTGGDAGAYALTSFPEGLAQFCGVAVEAVRTPGVADAALRRAEGTLDAAKCAATRGVLATSTNYPRLAAVWESDTLGRLAREAGFARGEFGEALASLADAFPAALLSPPARASFALSVPTARPSPFGCRSAALALVMIDWQRDFLEVGGFGDSLGNDVKRLQAAVAPTARLLAAARGAGLTIVHTLEAHDKELHDCPPSKKRRCSAIGQTLDPSRGRVLVRGEPGNAIIEELKPREGEVVVHKPGKGAFFGTDMDAILRRRGVSHLLFSGVTTEVCVQTTMREANDRGYECLLVSDATESYFEEFKKATIEMVVAQGGIVGWVATADELVKALST